MSRSALPLDLFKELECCCWQLFFRHTGIFLEICSPERGDFMVNGPAKWEFELTDLSIQLLTEQQGLLLVGAGYTVKKVTIE